MSAPSTTFSGSGGACLNTDRSSFSIDPGMAAFWSNASKVSRRKRSGGAPIVRSTSSSAFLSTSGIRLVKLFLHITPNEQRRRFRNRLIDPVKRWKLSYEDFRNRDHWREYESSD